MFRQAEPLSAILAHGKGYNTPLPDNPELVQPSLDSLLTAAAAGIIYCYSDSEIAYDRIILSGGQTAGEQYPSEAEVMRRSLRQRFDETDIPDEAIISETESFDTVTNLERVNEICISQNIGQIALLSVGYHLPRIRKLAAKKLEVPVLGEYRSDYVVGNTLGIHKHFYASCVLARTREDRSLRPLAQTAYSYALEGTAWGLLTIDPSGDGISRKITAKMRHQ